MNGIHEVTGSIPVWSTILRSRVQAKDVRHSVAERRDGGPLLSPGATAGKPCQTLGASFAWQALPPSGASWRRLGPQPQLSPSRVLFPSVSDR